MSWRGSWANAIPSFRSGVFALLIGVSLGVAREACEATSEAKPRHHPDAGESVSVNPFVADPLNDGVIVQRLPAGSNVNTHTSGIVWEQNNTASPCVLTETRRGNSVTTSLVCGASLDGGSAGGAR